MKWLLCLTVFMVFGCSSPEPTKDHIAYSAVAKSINSGNGFKPGYDKREEVPIEITGLSPESSQNKDPSKMSVYELVSDYKQKTSRLSPEFRKCANEYPKKNAGFPRVIKLTWTINKNGTVSTVRTASSRNLTDDALRCCEGKVAKLTFQPAKTGESLDTVFEEKF